MKTTFDLLRHGEVEGGTCYRGSTDDPLTEKGWQQMQKAVANQQGWDVIVSSPLIRCRHFAEQLSQQLNVPLIIEPDLAEIDFGDWEGKTADEIQQQDSEALKVFYQDPANNCPPSAEAYSSFALRSQTALQKTLDKHSGHHLLIITHGGVIRTLLSQALDIPFVKTLNINCEHACISRLQRFQLEDSEFIQLVFHNRSGV